MMLDLHKRAQIELGTINTFQQLPHHGNPQRDCLMWSYAAAKTLRDHGYRACINAGSAWFRMNREAEGPDAFSYEWQQGSTLQELLELDHLPEIHCWAVVPFMGLIFDPTTGYLPGLVKEKGYEWQMPIPPDMLWCEAGQTEDFIYAADELATLYATTLVCRLIKERSRG